MPNSGQTLTCFVETVFEITSLCFICMSDILAMVWYIWFKNHIENIEHFKNEDYLNLKNESDLTNEDDYKTEDDLKKKDVHKQEDIHQKLISVSLLRDY